MAGSYREDNSLTFITEIKKRECLYNYHLPEYIRKDLTDKAWGEIGEIMGLTVSECKEKWRNIRSAYLRSLKFKSGKTKRPYYLAEDLQFLLPYTKHRNLGEQNYIETEVENQEQEGTFESPTDTVYLVDSNNSEVITGSPLKTDPQIYDNEVNFDSGECPRRQKRRVTELERSILDYLEYKKKKASTQGMSHTPQSATQHFFLSLAPDLDSMTQEQLLRFKIEVLKIIDKIKSND